MTMFDKGRVIRAGLSVSVAMMLGAGLLLYFMNGEEVTADASDVRHRAALMEKAFYDEAYGWSGKVACPDGVSGAIVNHHLLAKRLITETFSCIDPSTSLFVLVSPNHFSEGKAPILTSIGDWETPYGTLVADKGLGELLEGAGVAIVEEEPFDGEHGIGNLVAFLKRAAPDAKFLPIILKDPTDTGRIESLAEVLDEVVPQDAVIVGSFDFSHGLSEVSARHADRKSLAAITSLDRSRIRPLDIDAVAGLDLLFLLMKARGTERFTVHGQTNSAEITGEDIGDTTSYVTGVFSPGHAQGGKHASLLVVGDVLLSRGVGSAISSYGLWSLVEPIHRLFWGSDAVIGQLEGAVSDAAGDPDAFPPRFPIDEEVLSEVRRAGFTHFSLSTNHTMDAGAEGLEDTRAALTGVGIGNFGDFKNRRGDSIIERIGGMRIGLVGYHDFGSGDADVIIEEIESLRDATDRIVVFAHWGIEGSANIDGRQREIAESFIDAGADIVLGSHPHVIQPMEMYEGKPIFYSLGNFLFDQVKPAERAGLAVGVHFSETETHITAIPIESERIRLSLVHGEPRDKILEDLNLASGEVTIPYPNYGK